MGNYDFSPSQFNLNAYKIMAGMYVLWKRTFGINLTIEEFCFLYKRYSKRSKGGSYFLALYEKKGLIILNLPSSCER